MDGLGKFGAVWGGWGGLGWFGVVVVVVDKMSSLYRLSNSSELTMFIGR